MTKIRSEMAGVQDTKGAVARAIELAQAEGDRIEFPPPEEFDLSTVEWAALKKLMVGNHGKWNRKGFFSFPFPVEELLVKFQAGERPLFKKDFHYFPTPDEVVDRMFQIHICLDDGKFLEPSAGQGAIIDWIETEGAPGWGEKGSRWDCIEVHPMNRAKLIEKGYNLIHDDFDTWEPEPIYDCIYANPPFKHDRAHVEKMMNSCAKGGSVICVLPGNFENKKQNQPLIEEMQERFEDVGFYPIESGAFKASGTMVDTTILYASHCEH